MALKDKSLGSFRIDIEQKKTINTLDTGPLFEMSSSVYFGIFDCHQEWAISPKHPIMV